MADIDIGEDVTRTIVRTAYLIVAGILFLYFGAILEQERLRYARLAAWPAGLAPNDRFPALDRVFAHLAETVGVGHVLVVWEDNYEPHRFVAEFRDGATRYTIEDPAGDAESEAAARANLRDAVPRRMLAEHGIARWISSPVRGASHEGWLVLAAENDLGDDLLPLAAIAALRVGAEIEHHYLRLRLVEAAVREGRSRLARDIHDSLLQALAATALQLKAVERDLPGAGAKKIAEIRESIGEQQDRLRRFVNEARDGHAEGAAAVPVEAALAKTLSDMRMQWNCRTSLAVEPAQLAVGRDTAEALCLFVAEAVANGARHADASAFKVDLNGSRQRLAVRLRDNGSGLAGLHGDFPHELVFARELGSASLRRRAEDLGATIHLNSAPDGLTIELTVPLA